MAIDLTSSSVNNLNKKIINTIKSTATTISMTKKNHLTLKVFGQITKNGRPEVQRR